MPGLEPKITKQHDGYFTLEWNLPSPSGVSLARTSVTVLALDEEDARAKAALSLHAIAESMDVSGLREMSAEASKALAGDPELRQRFKDALQSGDDKSLNSVFDYIDEHHPPPTTPTEELDDA